MKILRKFHIYLAIFASAFLFILTYFGTISYFKDEINFYMQPAFMNQKTDIKSASEFALKNYENYEIISIKTPDYFNNNYQINYYDRASSKSEKKQNIAFFDGNLEHYTPTLAAKFLTSIHYKILPVHGNLKQILKAIPSIFALLFVILIISGILIHLKKISFEYNKKNPAQNLLNFHTSAGIFLAFFLFWLSVSGIGLNYFKDINAYLQSQDSQKIHKKSNKTQSKKILNEIKIDALLQAFDDAKKAFDSQNLSLVISKPNKMIFISKSKNEKPFLDAKHKNNEILIYDFNGVKNKKFSQKASVKKLDELAFFYELFASTHRVNFAPLYLKIALFFVGILSCFFIYKALEFSSLKRPNSRIFKHFPQAIFYSSFLSTLAYFIANKVIPIDCENRIFYEQLAFGIIFFYSLIASFFVQKNILKIHACLFLLLLLASDFFLANFTYLRLAFMLIFLIILLLFLRSFRANLHS